MCLCHCLSILVCTLGLVSVLWSKEIFLWLHMYGENQKKKNEEEEATHLDLLLLNMPLM